MIGLVGLISCGIFYFFKANDVRERLEHEMLEKYLIHLVKDVNRIDRRMQIPGCFLNTK